MVVGVVDLQLDMTVVSIGAGRRQFRSSEDLGTSLRLRIGYDLQKGCFGVSGLTLGGDGAFFKRVGTDEEKVQDTNRKSWAFVTYSLL